MYQHLLIATDGSDLAQKAVAEGLALAAALHARVTAVHVTEPWTAVVGGDMGPRMISINDTIFRLITCSALTRSIPLSRRVPAMGMYRFLECQVGHYMTRDVVVVSPDVSLSELEGLFAARDFNAFPVIEHDRLVGVVTKFDFLKAFVFTTRQMVPHYDELMSRSVREVMTAAIIDVQPDAPLTRVLQLMVDLRARSFPVRERDGQLAGIISREDIMRALKESVVQQD